MTVISPPGFLQASTYAAADLRRNTGTAVMQRSFNDPTHMGAAEGYTPGRAPSWSLSGLNLTVSPFAGFVENSFATDSGDYPVFNTANQLLTFAASSPTQSRIDLVGVEIEDAFYSGSNNDGKLVIVQGTPSSGTPTPPTPPTTFLPMLSASIAAGATTATLTGLRKIVPAAGGIAPMIDAQASDAGSFVGAYRTVDTAGSGNLPRSLLSGYGSDASWHGLQRFRLPRPTPSFGNTSAGTIADSSSQVIASVTIPDPGFPYYIVAGSGFLVHKGNTDLHTMEFRASNTIAVDTTTPPSAGSANLIANGWFVLLKDDGTLGNMMLPQQVSLTSWTGSHTVNLIVSSGTATGTLVIGPLSTDLSWHFDVEIMPA
jgi:hypothetical protein